MQRTAICTGITGQDSSYLAELLLEKGYQVVGLMRRSSTATTERIDHLRSHPDFHLVEGDITDASNMYRLVSQWKPDEFYNLAAMSHVGTSFEQPLATFQIDALGVLNILEAIRQTSPRTRFYQASTSELFGDTTEAPQNEQTRFNPCSPYAVSKLAAHHLVGLYRKAYGLHASAGILFNHECISPTATPVLVRRNGLIDVLPVGELCVYRDWATQPQTTTPDDLEIWDQSSWTRVKALTVIRTRDDDSDHRLICVNSRGGSFVATAHHKALDANSQEIRVDALAPGSRVSLCSEYPCAPQEMHVSEIEAEFLGYMVADGYVAEDGNQVTFTKNDSGLRDRVALLWRLLTGGKCRTTTHVSGFGGTSTHLLMNGADQLFKKSLRQQLYTQDSFKRVPKRVLNSPSCWQAFVEAYYKGDGLKPGANTCTYRYQSFKTNSPTLAAGIVFLVQSLTGQTFNINAYFNRDVLTYHINFHSPDQANKGAHLRKPVNEVTKTLEMPRERFVVDIETASGTFHCGVGLAHVHNSPRRGEQFVTRKITKYVSDLIAALASGVATLDENGFPSGFRALALGNLDARRDWGLAADFAEAMFLILQHEMPDDYVIATGETHSVREFLDAAFGLVGLDWKPFVTVREDCMRPADVNLLQGDASKAREKLGWRPRVTFEGLVHGMIEADLALHGLTLDRARQIVTAARGDTCPVS